MPNEPSSISRQEQRRVIEDFEALRTAALAAIPRWCGDQWTNFNENDPGVAILEVLCYALTELGYRTSLDIEQFLLDEKGAIDWDSNSFYLPLDALTTNPVTPRDYQKLLYDQYRHLLQATLTPLLDDAKVAVPGVTGRYHVWIVVDPDYPDWENPRDDVEATLNKHRNLCERFERIEMVQATKFRVNASIEIAPECSPEEVMANIYFALKAASSPSPTADYPLPSPGRSQTPRHYGGPRLEHGRFPEDAIEAVPTWEEVEARAQRAIFQLPSIAKVGALKFVVDGPGDAVCPFRWFVPERDFNLPDEPAGSCNLILSIISGSPIRIDNIRGNQHIQFRLRPANKKTSAKLSMPLSAPREKLPPLPEKYSDLAKYDSIQDDFPRIFRLFPGGQSDAPTVERRAQIKQLKGYLLGFEQLLADYLSQLANVKNLLSNATQTATCFWQPLYGVPGATPLLAGFNEANVKLSPEEEQRRIKQYEANPENSYQRGLATMSRDEDVFLRRRNEILDHLLARFGESYPRTGNATYQTIFNKEELLRAYRDVTYVRAAGLNLLPSDESRLQQLSGLEQKLTILLRRDHQVWGGPKSESDPIAGEFGESKASSGSRYYFAIEHLPFLPVTLFVPASDCKAAMTFPAALFPLQMTHVFLNWTANDLTDAFEQYVKDLVLQNTPAHIKSHFLWFECGGEDAREFAEFVRFREDWEKERFTAMVLAAPAAKHGDITVLDTAASRLFQWIVRRIAPQSAG